MVFAVSEGKIVLIVLGKIQSLWLRGDTLEGVVAEFAAVVAVGHDSLFGAEHHLFIHPRAVAAVVAGALHFFAEQHSDPFLSAVIIHHLAGNFQCNFRKKDDRDHKQDPSSPVKICRRKNSPQNGMDDLLGDALANPQSC